ncbi:Phosphatidate cytidylyltransferase, mitochondrial [Cyberlindnera fabianii]|nr:Phosphatidate cytidylyltransferase, mitochondrial [Cyberlindnera fabianii]
MLATTRLARTSLFVSKRMISSATEPSAKELAESSVIFGDRKTKKRTQEPTQENTVEDLSLLDESIRKAEYLSHGAEGATNGFEKLPSHYAKNQHIDIDQTNTNELRSILWQFDAPIRYAFAYGSGVFSQGYSTPDTQTDLIFAVTYPQHWHSINMKYNKDHYSSLRYFGSGVVSKFQEVGAGVYFNPYVEIDGKLVKYGVVSVDTLVNDLAKWNTFYLAGRLQKPVKILRDDTKIRFWNQQNLKAAASLAYMNLPEDQPFDEFQFYKNITELSYKGDVRYTLGAENPKKIENIVEKNFEYFQKYYSPIMNEVIGEKKFFLPPGFTKENANAKLQDTIFRSSTSQMAKGLFTAGVSKSVKYAWAKKVKARASK